MNVSVEFLLQVIGTKEVELQALNAQIVQLKAQLEKLLKQDAPKAE